MDSEQTGMFGGLTAARQRKMPRWIPLLIGVSLGIHVLVIAGLVVHGWWEIDALAMPREGVSLAVVAPPPTPPAAAPKGTSLRHRDSQRVKRPGRVAHHTREAFQPNLQRADPEGDGSIRGEGGGGAGGSPVGDPNCSEGAGGAGGAGGIGGCRGTCVGIACAGDTIGSTIPPDECVDDCDDEVQNVPQHAVDALRKRGVARILPPDAVRSAIQRDHAAQVVTTVKMCLSKTGAVTSTGVLQSSGYPAYDAKIRAAMRSWRYRPFRVNGSAVRVCTAVTFRYRQR